MAAAFGLQGDPQPRLINVLPDSGGQMSSIPVMPSHTVEAAGRRGGWTGLCTTIQLGRVLLWVQVPVSFTEAFSLESLDSTLTNMWIEKPSVTPLSTVSQVPGVGSQRPRSEGLWSPVEETQAADRAFTVGVQMPPEDKLGN